MKLDIIEERGFECEKCGKKTKWLHLHHKTYERLYDERGSDLQLVCASCHLKIHKLTKPRKRNKKKLNQNADRQKLKKWYNNKRKKIKRKRLVYDYYAAVMKLNTKYWRRRKKLMCN